MLASPIGEYQPARRSGLDRRGHDRLRYC